MPSPYANSEVSQTGDPTMGQLGQQNVNVNDSLYASAYPTAPGRPADASGAAAGADLANQGLQKLSQGDRYGGIMTLLDAAAASPQSVSSPEFLNQLQIVESQAPTQSSSDSYIYNGAPTDAGAETNASLPSDGASPVAGADAQNQATQLGIAALQSAQSDPVSSILGLMKAETLNPDLLNNQDFVAKMSETLSSGQGAQPPMDASQAQATQPSMDASQTQTTQPSMDASQTQTTQPSMDASQTQPSMDATQQATQPQGQMQFALAPGAPLTDTTNNPQSADPQIQQAVLQAFQLLQSGDQLNGAALLMQIAKVNPEILQDQTFIKNLQTVEQASQIQPAAATTDSSSMQAMPADASAMSYQSTPTDTSAMSYQAAPTDTSAMSYQAAPTDTSAMPVPDNSQTQIAMDPSVGAPTVG